MAKKRVDKAAAGSRRPLLILVNGGETAVVHAAFGPPPHRGGRRYTALIFGGTYLVAHIRESRRITSARFIFSIPIFPMLNHVPITDAQRKWTPVIIEPLLNDVLCWLYRREPYLGLPAATNVFPSASKHDDDTESYPCL